MVLCFIASIDSLIYLGICQIYLAIQKFRLFEDWFLFVGCPALTMKCIILQNNNGFGLTVSGDKPVYVQTVKEG